MKFTSTLGNLTKEQSITIGAYAKKLRLAKGISRARASDGSGLSPAWIQKFETHKHTGNSEFSPLAILTYCSYLGMETRATYDINYTPIPIDIESF